LLGGWRVTEQMSCAHFYADVVGQCVFSAEHSLAQNMPSGW
jgi:hypothetical protein